MPVDFDSLAASHGFGGETAILRDSVLPCVGFSLERGSDRVVGASRLGGGPDLPAAFPIPTNDGQPLDFLLQVDLRQLSRHDRSSLFPRDGLLSFFYDLEQQPWGFDPKNLGGFRVLCIPDGTSLERRDAPRPDHALEPSAIHLWPSLSLPSHGSRAGDRLLAELEKATGGEVDFDSYDELSHALFRAGAPSGEGPSHRFGGHSKNVQNDMQLEAQLVTHGLYCGDATGYEDPRAQALEATCEDWRLILQLDSDDEAGFMWGDAGMLYYWARAGDIAGRDFSRSWMTLQCG